MAKPRFTAAARALLAKRTEEHHYVRPVIRVAWLKPGWDKRRVPNGEAEYFQDGYEGWSVVVMDWNDPITTKLRDIWVVTRYENLDVSFSPEVEEFSGELVIDEADSKFTVTAI